MWGHKIYHIYGLKITLRGCLSSSRSFQSNSEIKANRQRTATTGQDACSRTKVLQDRQGEHSLWAETVRKRIWGEKTFPSWVFSHICDTVVSTLFRGQHAGTQSQGHTHVWSSQELGYVRQLFQCLTGTITKELDLEMLLYLRFQVLWTLMKPPDMFPRHIYI